LFSLQLFPFFPVYFLTFFEFFIDKLKKILYNQLMNGILMFYA